MICLVLRRKSDMFFKGIGLISVSFKLVENKKNGELITLDFSFRKTVGQIGYYTAFKMLKINSKEDVTLL